MGQRASKTAPSPVAEPMHFYNDKLGGDGADGGGAVTVELSPALLAVLDPSAGSSGKADVARRTAEMRREQQQLQQAAEETARRNARDQKRTEFAEGYHTSVVTRAADGLIATHPMKNASEPHVSVEALEKRVLECYETNAANTLDCRDSVTAFLAATAQAHHDYVAKVSV